MAKHVKNMQRLEAYMRLLRRIVILLFVLFI